MAKKLQSSLAVEGELPEDGLAAYGDDGDDLMLALARKIVAGEEDADSVESVFAQARLVAAEAQALLVDADWREPEAVAVEAVTDNRDDAPEPQRSLFSWAEFMAAEPTRHRRERPDSARSPTATASATAASRTWMNRPRRWCGASSANMSMKGWADAPSPSN